MRILAALLVTAVATAACGGSEAPPSSATASPSASATPTIDSAAAPAAAKASLLVAADVPGSTATPAEKPDAAEEALEDKTDACVGITPIDYLAEEQSPSFLAGEFPDAVQTASEATVAPTAELARAEFTAFASDKATGCFQAFLKESLSDLDEPGVSFELGKVTERSTPVPTGAEAALGFEFTATLKGEGITLPVRGVIVAALVGQVAATVSTTGFGTAAATADASADRLLGVVTTRAVAAQG